MIQFIASKVNKFCSWLLYITEVFGIPDSVITDLQYSRHRLIKALHLGPAILGPFKLLVLLSGGILCSVVIQENVEKKLGLLSGGFHLSI